MFTTGMQVRHRQRPEWGAGSVTRVEPLTRAGTRDQRLWIKFGAAGLKTLLASAADLEVVEGSGAAEHTFAAREIASEGGWLGTITKRRPEQAMISETVAAPVDDNDQTEVSEVAEIAHRAFERLRPEQKRVLHLSIRQGQSHEQIATTTGLPLGTVKTHARRGLIRLRELLAAEGLPVEELSNPQRPEKGDDPDGPG